MIVHVLYLSFSYMNGWVGDNVSELLTINYLKILV